MIDLAKELQQDIIRINDTNKKAVRREVTSGSHDEYWQMIADGDFIPFNSLSSKDQLELRMHKASHPMVMVDGKSVAVKLR